MKDNSLFDELDKEIELEKENGYVSSQEQNLDVEENNKKATKLCIVSLFTYLIPALIFAGMQTAKWNVGYPGYVIIPLFLLLVQFVAVMMVIVCVCKYRESVFAKVLLIIYIVLFIVKVAIFAAFAYMMHMMFLMCSSCPG